MITFQNTGLSEDLLKALDELGFKQPTPIQAQCIPHLLSSKKDLIALAQTGTGKTAAFSLPLIEQIDPQNPHVQALILCPTRELCMQTARNIEAFTTYLKQIKVLAAYGGTRIEQQIKALRSGAQLVVGTPGRILDLITRRKLKGETIRYVVLDEADEMLNMGFQEELDGILEGTPDDKQTLLFSATMPKNVLAMTSKYMKKPDQIRAGNENKGADKVDHLYYMVHARDRYEALRRIADVTPDIYGIVFCRTKRETQEVADKLIRDHYSAEAIHGDLSQDQRSQVMSRFRRKKTQLLVATDVAARGIDVNDLTHVINYNLPDSVDAYIHRSGRTGRAQKSGTSLSIIHMKEARKIRFIEKKVGKTFIRAQVPKGSDICKSQLISLIKKVQNTTVNEEHIAPYLPEIHEHLKDFSREELIKQFVSTEFNRFLATYKDAPDLNVQHSGSGRDQKKRGTFSQVSLNIGKKDQFGIKTLFSLVNKHRSIKGIEIGNIDIQQSSTLLEIEPHRIRDFCRSLDGSQYYGKTIVAKSSDQKPQRSFDKKPSAKKRVFSKKGYVKQQKAKKAWKKKKPVFPDGF